ncbi:MAG TPA: hypothetical protein VN920_12025, partial [Pyrinomonadaceae bacterium]|nr:hypothetical protein [Pyrinomonadaceae bacterium]
LLLLTGIGKAGDHTPVETSAALALAHHEQRASRINFEARTFIVPLDPNAGVRFSTELRRGRLDVIAAPGQPKRWVAFLSLEA